VWSPSLVKTAEMNQVPSAVMYTDIVWRPNLGFKAEGEKSGGVETNVYTIQKGYVTQWVS